MFRGDLASWWYNFRWDDYEKFFGSPILKVITAIPLVGYLIVFNDVIIRDFGFNTLTGNSAPAGFLDQGLALRFVYFGLVALALGAMVFSARKPRALRQASTQSEYIKFAREVFTPRDYLDIHTQISREGHVTLSANDASKDWQLFWDNLNQSVGAHQRHSYSETINRFSGLVAAYAIDNYTRQMRGRRTSLTISLVLASTGFAFLALPSLDLFYRVVLVTLGLSGIT